MSNKRNRRTLEYDVTDAPMLVHALTIARNTAMMSGDKLAQKRLEEYRAVLRVEVPPEARLFDEEGWAEMGMALAAGLPWGVTVRRLPWDTRWMGKGALVIQIGDTKWRSRGRDFANDAPEIEQVAAVLAELAPLDSERLDLPVETWEWA